MIKINGKKMSKAWHYDACIEMWNEISEYIGISDRCGEDIKGKIKIIEKYNPSAGCFSCEFFKDWDNCHQCAFTIHSGGYSCMLKGPYLEFECGRGTRQDAIEIAQLFIDYYPETDEELTYRDF